MLVGSLVVAVVVRGAILVLHFGRAVAIAQAITAVLGNLAVFVVGCCSNLHQRGR